MTREGSPSCLNASHHLGQHAVIIKILEYRLVGGGTQPALANG